MVVVLFIIVLLFLILNSGMLLGLYRENLEYMFCEKICCNKQWYPIEDGAPESEGFYIGWVKKGGESGVECAEVLFCSVDEEGKSYFLLRGDDMIVTHWAYMPDPPAEGEKND